MAQTKQVKRILFITLSNIGDVVLTLPSLDYLKNKFENAQFTVVSGPAAKPLFENDPRIKENISYNKHLSFTKKFRFWRDISKQRFEVVVDLRDTIFRWFYSAPYKNPKLIRIPFQIKHLRLRHLYKTLLAVKENFNIDNLTTSRQSVFIDEDTLKSTNNLLKIYGLSADEEYIVVAIGSKNKLKQWHVQGFVEVISKLVIEYPVILLGENTDENIADEIQSEIRSNLINLVGKTDLKQAISIIEKAKLVLCNDSAVSHLASYFNRPVAVIFGPTDEEKYGPWSEYSAVIRKNTICTPCQSARCWRDWQCMKGINSDFVLAVVNSLLQKNKVPSYPSFYRRILISRTDRLGDVLLSTPVIKNLRDRMPSAYIAMMVSKVNKEVVEGNPYLDEVITFDKRGEHKGLVNSIRFANKLRQKRFDLALILHPSNRVHLILFFANIPKRVGYDIKLGFLNNHRIRHTKQLGTKHEIDYALDFLRELGMSDFDKNLFMPIYKEAEEWADNFFKKLQLSPQQQIVVIHPQASCPSKMWPRDYFKKLIEHIIENYHPKIIQIGSQKNFGKIHKDVIDLSGMTTISELASIIKRSSLLISNDSGPVHVAVALGIPVISIFGRKQPGLSPARWGHVQQKAIVLHKDAGCSICLAHNCKNDFQCLRLITPEEVLDYVKVILN